MCTKKTFEDLESAKKRAIEINNSNRITTYQKKTLRAYSCNKCSDFHLTSMPKKIFSKWVTQRNQINKKREQKFIRLETEYYEKLFNLI